MNRTKMIFNRQLYSFRFFTIVLLALLVVVFMHPVAAELRQIKRAPQLKVRNVQSRLILRPMRTDIGAVKAIVKRRIVLPRNLGGRDRRVLNAIVRDIRHKNLSSANKRWRLLVQGLATRGTSYDINAMIQWVIRQSYLETNKDLKYYAAKVKYFNELKKRLREEIADTRSRYNDASSWPLKVNRIVRLPRTYRPGATARFSRTTTMMTREQFAAYINELEKMFSTLRGTMSFFQMDLQQSNQAYIRILSTLSAMMKSQNDTLKSIIRNLK